MYFSPQTFNTYYPLLQYTDPTGKLGRETTTGLAVFFSLDRMQKLTGSDTIDLHPESQQREDFTNQFVETLMVADSEDGEFQAADLGFIEISGITLAKKLSSNFLTVPVKKGSRQTEILHYPGRPAPLVDLGIDVPLHGKWGITKNQEWPNNFLRFIDRRRCGVDTFPLIAFLLRDKPLLEVGEPPEVLFAALNEFLTEEVSSFLVEHADIPVEWEEEVFFAEELVPLNDYLDHYIDFDVEPEEQHNLIDVISVIEEPFEIDGRLLKKIEAAINSGSHIILTGPPGTGKTTIATMIATRFKGTVGYETFTATSNWTAFEVLGGYLPDPLNPQTLQFEEGFIIKSVKENKWVIIDEINRADVDKAFGELFTVLTGKPVYLPYYLFMREANGIVRRKKIAILPEEQENRVGEESEKYLVRQDWRIIGTMNTFDKSSLYQLSYAFMRRFAFIEVEPPTSEKMQDILGQIIGQMEIGEDYKEEIRVNLINLFANGLFTIGFAVGVAIPINVIKYLEKRIGSETEIDEPIVTLIIEAISMYLFPQFEGKRRAHDRLLQAIISSFEITEPEVTARVNVELSSWTGNMIG